jgi:hypothetical protein
MNHEADLAYSLGEVSGPRLKRPRTPPGARGFALQ